MEIARWATAALPFSQSFVSLFPASFGLIFPLLFLFLPFYIFLTLGLA